MATTPHELDRLALTTRQVIMNCSRELRSAERWLDSGHPDIAVSHLHTISQLIQKQLPPEDPESPEDPDLTKRG